MEDKLVEGALDTPHPSSVLANRVEVLAWRAE
jgi:hypothetical protein